MRYPNMDWFFYDHIRRYFSRNKKDNRFDTVERDRIVNYWQGKMYPIEDEL